MQIAEAAARVHVFFRENLLIAVNYLKVFTLSAPNNNTGEGDVLVRTGQLW